jgi:hypothetical protein
MTVITNLVVALMIVTNGMESVKARVVDDSPPENEWIVKVCGPVETLYRKTCKTNYVYSADIPVECVSAFCHAPCCNNRKRFTIDELFGRRVMTFSVLWDDPIFCKKHEEAEVKK